MTQKDEKKLILLEGTKTEEQTANKVVSSRQTNPIVKKLLQFHNENSEKFSVKDLFKK